MGPGSQGRDCWSFLTPQEIHPQASVLGLVPCRASGHQDNKTMGLAFKENLQPKVIKAKGVMGESRSACSRAEFVRPKEGARGRHSSQAEMTVWVNSARDFLRGGKRWTEALEGCRQRSQISQLGYR